MAPNCPVARTRAIDRSRGVREQSDRHGHHLANLRGFHHGWRSLVSSSALNVPQRIAQRVEMLLARTAFSRLARSRVVWWGRCWRSVGPWSSTLHEMSTALILLFASKWPRTTARLLVKPSVSFVAPMIFDSSALYRFRLVFCLIKSLSCGPTPMAGGMIVDPRSSGFVTLSRPLPCTPPEKLGPALITMGGQKPVHQC